MKLYCYCCCTITASVQTQDVVYKDLPEVMDNRDGWQERVRETCASSAT